MSPTIVLPLIFLLGIFQLTLCSIPSSPNIKNNNNNQSFRSNPYEILHVDSQSTQKEIQRSYRALCLKHHPDKKRSNDENDGATKGRNNKKGGSSSSSTSKENGDDDFEFKEVQHAYSLVGTENDRRNYDLRRKFSNLQSHSSSSSSSSPSHSFSRQYAANHQFGERPGMFGQSSTIYFTFGDGVFKFSRGSSSSSSRHDNNMFQRRRGYPHNNPFFGTDQRFGEMSQHTSTPHYIQKISIPLHVLYSGRKNVELKLKTSIFERYKAAFHGGVLKPALMQASITVIMTWLRSQKVNWFLSVFLFVSMVHVHVPPPPKKVLYSTNIRRGWKGGTKIKYKSSPSSNAEENVVFVLQEDDHDTFTRVGNDLHARVQVSARQLRKGCTLTIDPLCESEKTIKLRLGPKEAKDGQVVTVKSRGWPIIGSSNEEEEFGDLHVEICCNV